MTTNIPSSRRPSPKLTEYDAALAKGMLERGDKQHDVAAFFGVNGGRIAEIAQGIKFAHVKAKPFDELPPSGPYEVRVLIGRLRKH